jgi:hypothetical protein
VFSECRRWFVRLEIGNGYGTLANKAERDPKVAISLVQSQNIAIKVKGPDRSNVSPSAVDKGCNDVVLLMPISGNLRVQTIKGGFYIYKRFFAVYAGGRWYYAPLTTPTSVLEYNCSIAPSSAERCAAK